MKKRVAISKRICSISFYYPILKRVKYNSAKNKGFITIISFKVFQQLLISYL